MTKAEMWARGALLRKPELHDWAGLSDADLIERAEAIDKMGRATGRTKFVPSHIAELLRRVRVPPTKKEAA